MSEIRPQIDLPVVQTQTQTQTQIQESNPITIAQYVQEADKSDLKYLCVSEYCEETVQKKSQSVLNEIFFLFGKLYPYTDNNSDFNRQLRKEARKLYIDKLTESGVKLHYKYYKNTLVSVIVSWKEMSSNFEVISNKQKAVRNAFEALLQKLKLWPIPNRPIHYYKPTSAPTIELEYLLEPDNFELTRNEIFSLFGVWCSPVNDANIYKDICKYYVNELNKTNAKVEYNLLENNSNILTVKVTWKGESAECRVVEGKQKAARKAFLALLEKLKLWPVSECPKVMAFFGMVPVYPITNNSFASGSSKEKEIYNSKEKEIYVTSMQVERKEAPSDNISIDKIKDIKDFDMYKEYVHEIYKNIIFKEKVLKLLYLLFNLIHGPDTPVTKITLNKNCVLGFNDIVVEQPKFYFMILKITEEFSKDNTSNKISKNPTRPVYDLLRQFKISPIKNTRGPEEHDPGFKDCIYSTLYRFDINACKKIRHLCEVERKPRSAPAHTLVSANMSESAPAPAHTLVSANMSESAPAPAHTLVSANMSESAPAPAPAHTLVSANMYAPAYALTPTLVSANMSESESAPAPTLVSANMSESESAPAPTLVSANMSESESAPAPTLVSANMSESESAPAPAPTPALVSVNMSAIISAPASVQRDFHSKISVLLENTRNEIRQNKTSELAPAPVSAVVSAPVSAAVFAPVSAAVYASVSVSAPVSAPVYIYAPASTHIPKVAEKEVKVTESEVEALCNKLEAMRTKLNQYIKKEVEDKAAKDKANKEARIKFAAMCTKLERMRTELEQYNKTEEREKRERDPLSASEDSVQNKKKK
jgi:hypothetical protein